MEADDTTPLCLRMIKEHGRLARYNYQRLKGVVTADDQKENVKTHQRFWKLINLIPEELMRKLRDGYVEMMIRFARHVSRLNNSRHFYLLGRNDPDSNQEYFAELNGTI